VGTLTDTRRAAEEARRANYVPIASHRSGESCEPHLAHVALAFNCPLLKLSVVGGERLIKINELMRLAGSLGMKLARFPLTAK
jgi:enolase